MKHVAILIVPLILIVAGCPQVGTPPASPSPTPPAGATAPPAANEIPGLYVVTLRAIIMEVPLGASSGSEDIWSYLDEEPAAAGTAGSLGRNGVRIGLGPSSTLSDLDRIFKRLAAQKVREGKMIGLAGGTFPIALKEHQGPETIFMYSPDRTLSGRDYPPGDDVFVLSCAVNPEEPNRAILIGLPQLRSSQYTPNFTKEGERYVLRSSAEVFNFEPAAFRFPVPSQGVVVIGPSSQSRRASSLGRQFLVAEHDGMEFETVLILIPTVGGASSTPTGVAAAP